MIGRTFKGFFMREKELTERLEDLEILDVDIDNYETNTGYSLPKEMVKNLKFVGYLRAPTESKLKTKAAKRRIDVITKPKVFDVYCCSCGDYVGKRHCSLAFVKSTS